MKATVWSALICVLAIGASAADAPALDALKYPQDTPQNALKSIIAAFEAKDFAYWLSHLLRPEDSARIIEKNGGLDKAVANNADAGAHASSTPDHGPHARGAAARAVSPTR